MRSSSVSSSRLMAVALVTGAALAAIGIAAGGRPSGSDDPSSMPPKVAEVTAVPPRSASPTATPLVDRRLSQPVDDTDQLAWVWAIPDASGLRAWSRSPISGVTEGAGTLHEEVSGRTEVAGRRGVMVGTLRFGSLHRCDLTGRAEAQTTPTGILEDLRTYAEVEMREPTATSVGGRPGWSTLIPPSSVPCQQDLHFGSTVGPWMPFDLPSRLQVVDVGGVTAVILTWARTPDDLTAFLPVADPLVGSIEFVNVSD